MNYGDYYFIISWSSKYWACLYSFGMLATILRLLYLCNYIYCRCYCSRFGRFGRYCGRLCPLIHIYCMKNCIATLEYVLESLVKNFQWLWFYDDFSTLISGEYGNKNSHNYLFSDRWKFCFYSLFCFLFFVCEKNPFKI